MKRLAGMLVVLVMVLGGVGGFDTSHFANRESGIRNHVSRFSQPVVNAALADDLPEPFPPPLVIDSAPAFAVRVDPPDPPPPDPCSPEIVAHVNALPYAEGDKGPTTEAFRLVALCAGFTEQQVSSYTPGVIDDIFPGESNQCPYHRAGQGTLPDCTPTGRATGSDAGFWQVTQATRNASGLCSSWGYCTASDMTRDAWSSMMPGVLLIIIDGRRPWCYSVKSCGYHPIVASWPRWFG